MNSALIRSSAIVLALSLVAVVAGLPANTYAETPTLTATQTVANVAPGANLSQANATTSTTANVAEVKASRILEVASLPVTSETITIGLCTVTFATTTAGSPAQDLNCAGGATITTATTSLDVAKTAVQIASDLAALTGVTDTGHGALSVAVGTTTSKVVFTTAGTEASATAVTFSDGTTGNINSVGSTSGVIPVAQVWAVTPANVEVGDIFTTIINGTTVSFTATAATVANVTAGLTSAINASAVASAVTATNQTTRVDVTSDTAGTAFTLTSSATNYPGVAQTVTFTPADVVSGDYTITINGVAYVYPAQPDDTVATVSAGLASRTDASDAVSCTDDGTKVTCVSSTAGTAFTYSTSAPASRPSSGSSHSSGGSRRSTANTSTPPSVSSNANLEAKLAELKAMLARLNASSQAVASVGTSVFSRDLEMGAKGDDVMKLQKYLNTHGFVIAATGAGSVGAETDLFGGLTRAALMKFQASAGITPAAGYFGPKTRAYIEAHP